MNNLTKIFLIIAGVIISSFIGLVSIYAFQDGLVTSACTWSCELFSTPEYYGTTNVVKNTIGTNITHITGDLVDHGGFSYVCFGETCTKPRSSGLNYGARETAVVLDSNTVAIRNFGKKPPAIIGNGWYYKCTSSGECDSPYNHTRCTASDLACRNITTPTIQSFTADPAIISGGAPSALSWASSDADSCVITNDKNSTSVSRATNSSMAVAPTSTTVYTLICLNRDVKSTPKTVTITVKSSETTSSGTSSSETTSNTNPYTSNLSSTTKNTINIWIAKNIKSRSATLSSSDYTKFVENIIIKLGQIKKTTPVTNESKINLINYIVWELQDIVSNGFLDTLFN